MKFAQHDGDRYKPSAYTVVRPDRLISAGCTLVVAIVLMAGSSADVAGAKAMKWSKPEQVAGGKSGASRFTDVSAGPKRYAVVAWITNPPVPGPKARPVRRPPSRVMASVRQPDQRQFTRPRPLSPTGALTIDVQSAPNGQTVLLWQDLRGRVRVRFRESRGRWSRVQTLAHEAEGAHLAIASDGGAIVTWQSRVDSEGGRAYAAIRSPGERFGRRIPLPAHPDAARYGLLPAIGSGGNAAVLRVGGCLAPPAPPTDRQATFLDTDAAAWTAWEPIGNVGCKNELGQLVVGPDGEAATVIGGRGSERTVRTAVRPPGGSFGDAKVLSGTRDGGVAANLAVDRGGNLATSFLRYRGDRPAGVEISWRPAGGSFSEPQMVSGPKAGGIHQLAMAPNGRTIALWQENLGTGRRAPIVAAAAPFEGEFSRFAPVFRRTPNLSLMVPALAISREGQGIAAWGMPRKRTGTERGIYVSTERLRRSR